MDLMVVRLFIVCCFLQLCGSVERGAMEDRCGLVKLDLVIVLDSSGSVGRQNFKRTIDFANDVIKRFPVQADATRVGLVRYSTKVDVITNLNEDMDTTTKMEAVNNMGYRPGATYTHTAIQTVGETVLTPEHGDRPDVPDLVILTTDGVSASQSRTKEAVRKLKERPDIQILAIGVGRRVNDRELLEIASSPEMVHHVTSFSKLSNIVKGLTNQICSENVTKSTIDNVIITTPTTTSTLPLNETLQNQIQASGSNTSSSDTVPSSSIASSNRSFVNLQFNSSSSSVPSKSSSPTQTSTLSSLSSSLSAQSSSRRSRHRTLATYQTTISPTSPMEPLGKTARLETEVTRNNSPTPQDIPSDNSRRFGASRRSGFGSRVSRNDDSQTATPKSLRKASSTIHPSTSTAGIETSSMSNISTPTTSTLSPDHRSTPRLFDNGKDNKPSLSVTSKISSTEMSTSLEDIITPSRAIPISSSTQSSPIQDRTTRRSKHRLATDEVPTKALQSIDNSTSATTSNEDPELTTTTTKDPTLTTPMTEDPVLTSTTAEESTLKNAITEDPKSMHTMTQHPVLMNATTENPATTKNTAAVTTITETSTPTSQDKNTAAVTTITDASTPTSQDNNNTAAVTTTTETSTPTSQDKNTAAVTTITEASTPTIQDKNTAAVTTTTETSTPTSQDKNTAAVTTITEASTPTSQDKNTAAVTTIPDASTPTSQDNTTIPQAGDTKSRNNNSTQGRSSHRNDNRKGNSISRKDFYVYLIAAAIGLIFLTSATVCMAVACKRRKRNTPVEDAGSRLRPLNNRVRYTE